MRILMFGVSHQTAAVELRERLALPEERLGELLAGFRRQFPAAELVVLNTCNRSEFYLARASHEAPSFEQLRLFLSQQFQVDSSLLGPAGICRENREALDHLFRVAAGLESMVLGEPQILGQVRRAYERSTREQALGGVLHRVFQQALAAAKSARHQTGIDTGRVSVGSVAAAFARQIFERFDDKIVVGIGAGEMAKATLVHLKDLQPKRLYLTNRTMARAQQLAEHMGLSAVNGEVRPFEQLDELLAQADIVLTSTSAANLITAAQARALMRQRRHRPLFLLDLGVPRNIEPAAAEVGNVYLYNVDDLGAVVQQTYQSRHGQIQQCETLLRTAVEELLHQIQNRDVGQVVRALQHRLHEIAQAEQDRTTRKMGSIPAEQLAAALPQLLEEHSRRLVNKILHLPLSQLNHQNHAETTLSFYTSALKRLFQLEIQEGAAPDQPGLDSAPGAPKDASSGAAEIQPDAPAPGPQNVPSPRQISAGQPPPL